MALTHFNYYIVRPCEGKNSHLRIWKKSNENICYMVRFRLV